jgi:hypothetical protein
MYETLLILRIIQRDIIKVHSYSYPQFLSDFNNYFNFLDMVSKNTEITSFTKFHAVESEMCHAHGRTERYDAANGRFPKFAKIFKPTKIEW